MAFMRSFATCAILLALACSAPAQQQSTGQGIQAPAVPSSGDAAARVGNRTITIKEVDERWRRDDAAQQTQALQQLYDGRRNALDAIIAETLIAEAAKAKGMNANEFMDSEVKRRIKPVTEGQVVSFFQQNQAQMQGRGLEAMSPAIRRYLEEQERGTAYRAFVGELRKAGPRVDTMIDAPRYTVEVAPDDPALGAANAPVTVVEFSDFQCPFCRQVMPTLKKLREAYGDRMRIVWKDFPLTVHSPAGLQGGRSRQLRARAEQVLGVSRPPVREPAGARRRLSEEIRSRHGPRRREVQRLPRHRQVCRARAGTDGRWQSAWRQLNAVDVRQWPDGEWSAALRSVHGNHRRGAGTGSALAVINHRCDDSRNQHDLPVSPGLHHRNVCLRRVCQRHLAADDRLQRSAFEPGASAA